MFMMKKLIIAFLCTLVCHEFTIAMEQELFKEERLGPQSGLMYVDDFFKAPEIEQKELLAMTLEKGSTFYVKSLQPMSSDTPEGARIDFEADTKIFSNDKISHVVFTGEVIENKPPRLAGRTSTLKLAIYKMKVDNVIYPIEAYVSKMGKKNVMGGILSGAPNYMNNLAHLANNGTMTIDKVYKDPCQYSCETIVAPLRPCYYLGGAFLQLADLCLAPLLCIFQRGSEINIPENSSFEIKLASDTSVLRL